MRSPVPAKPHSFSTVWNFLVQQLLDETGDIDHDFWTYCSGQLHRLEGECTKDADEAACYDTRRRFRVIARECEDLAHPGDEHVQELRAAAKGTYANLVARVEEEHAGFWIASIRLCMLMGDFTAEDLGISPDALVLPHDTLRAA